MARGFTPCGRRKSLRRPSFSEAVLRHFTRGLLLDHLRWIEFLLRFLTQLGSILGANLRLCWALFRVFFRLETRAYLEDVLASIFHRFFFDFGPLWKIENNRFVL